ncbi:MAG: UDP-N-acetylmuramate dehydrogenase [Clostridiales Family XIII bacterium]|jgi:UDP-N-acetylmuramate dehydrogenase|nr:UDP-N-acetylmuramate dehydrogenase [Clostridiales Family XIII bacterium]
MNNLSSAIRSLYRDVIIKEDEPLSGHTSMKVGGKADYYIRPRSEPSLIGVIGVLRELRIPYYLLGGGTNVVVRDGGFRGAVVAIGKGFDSVDIDEGRGIVTAGAGAALSAVAKKAAKAGLSGLEPLSGIPGTVGGALYMNAGSYGSDMSRVVTQAKVYDTEADRLKTMSMYEMRLGYRSSLFQSVGSYVIISVAFRLKKRDTATIGSAMRLYSRQRRSLQPMDMPSAGSFFKRPAGAYAGELIESAGLKGLGVGGAQVSEKHAGFIVNTGGATASDVIGLMAKVQEAVRAGSGYGLVPEPRIIGEDI